MSVVADIIPLLYIQIFISLSSLEFIQELEEIGLILEHWNPWKLLTIQMSLTSVYLIWMLLTLHASQFLDFGAFNIEGSQILVQFIFHSNNVSSECSGPKGCPRKTLECDLWCRGQKPKVPASLRLCISMIYVDFKKFGF